MKQVFHKRARTGKVQVWSVELDGKFFHVEHGKLNGKMQKVTDEGKVKNAGRSNETSPEEDSKNRVDRLILLKTREGYVPEGKALAADGDIDWAAPLPENLAFYKPSNTLSVAMSKKIEANTAVLGRKREGEMMPLVINDQGDLDVYSRRMRPSYHHEPDKPWALRFSHLVEEVRLRDIPPNTIFLCEMVAGPYEDDVRFVNSIIRSSTTEALEKQRFRPLFVYVWDIAVWDGVEILTHMPYEERIELIWSVFDNGWSGDSWFLPIDLEDPDDVREQADLLGLIHADATNVEAAMELSKYRKWEGWVAIDPKGVLGDRAFNLRGKPDRPSKFSGKVKPVYEDDFVAFFSPDSFTGPPGYEGPQGKWGNGKYRGQAGAVSLYQYDKNGVPVYISDCGSGIDDEFRRLYSDPGAYPLCVRVLYTTRTYVSDGDDTNALIEPRIDAVRVDKDIDECINPRL